MTALPLGWDPIEHSILLCAPCVSALFLSGLNIEGHGETRDLAQVRNAREIGHQILGPTGNPVGLYALTMVKGTAVCPAHLHGW